MDSVIKAVIVYFVLWVIIRASGRRTLGQLTVFERLLNIEPVLTERLKKFFAQAG